ncbi:hypothetical protein GTP38_19030 [Duganella sp. FT94W]|uniref:RiboL-PSP-HEPN domain-containing protein n=1 Tax=Duganella lactea TaxID=2692173 RepID=A0ABW9V9V6_9BURK|nr:hypothetical protein [Duganella lactea]MYM36426.1 hypothetical protein [Duganella lactea]
MPSDQRDKEDLDNLSRMVGLLVIQWGSAEQTLELTVSALFNSGNGPKVKSGKVPQQLTAKLEYLSRCADHMVELKSIKISVDKLINDFKILSNLRHSIIHGAASSINHIDGVYSFGRIDLANRVQTHRTITLDVRDFDSHISKFIKLGADTYAVGNFVFDKYFRK